VHLTLHAIPDRVILYGYSNEFFRKENYHVRRQQDHCRGIPGGWADRAAIALLYAPKAGRETRRDISKAAKKIKRDAVELVEDTIQSIDEFAGDVKDKATDIIERVWSFLILPKRKW